MLHWHILGAGAMGCLYATYLARSGCSVTLLQREPFNSPSPPLTLERENQYITQQVTFETAATLPHKISLLLVTTKAHQVTAALHAVKHQLAAGAVIILLHNGMGVLEELLPEFKAYQILQIITTLGAYRRSRWHIVHSGEGAMWLGQLQGQTISFNQEILSALETAGLKTQWDDNITQRMWEKLAINAAINPLTALLKCKNGELLNKPPAKSLLHTLCEEAANLLCTQGLNINALALWEKVCEVLHNTANNYSSMYQDIQQGKTTEIKYINEYLCNNAKKAGIAMPTHECITTLMYLLQHEIGNDNG